MRVFVTGATGFVGTSVVKELLSAGHSVLGLARSDKGADQLKSQGADVLHGTIEDLDILKKGAAESDAVIHLAFVHNFADFVGSCAKDRAAITALGDALVEAGGNRALAVTSGTMLLTRGKLNDEDDVIDMNNHFAAARGPSEPLTLDYAKKGLRASVVRLPPTTHGPGQSGFAGHYVTAVLQKGEAAYVGDGQNRWCAGHRDDAAKVYRLAIEKAKPGSVFHAVGEEGVKLKDIAIAVGRQLNVPVVSLEPEKVPEYYGWFQMAVTADNTASSKKTRERLGWEPTHLTLVEDVPAIIDFVKAKAA